MNVGRLKGKIVTDLIAEVKPETMVELGGYVGYSAILFGDALRRAGGKRYLSLERNPEFAAVSNMLVDLAGLRDIVRIIVGRSDLSLHKLYTSGELKHIELMFLDHYKPAYTTDLKLCEHYGMVSPGTVLAADNVIYPGNPPYLEYVRSSVEQKRKAANESAGKGYNFEGIKERTKNQYRNKEGDEKPALDFVGNPNLVYESKLVNSFEPTGQPDGIEITRCVGVEPEP
ncbi:catechol O-methyltransferase [Thermoascus aurantiacus ATCC 26904]